MSQATPIENDDSVTRFSFPAAQGKTLTAAFDGGRLASDGSVRQRAQNDRDMGICDQLARCIVDRRDHTQVMHTQVMHTKAPKPRIADVSMPHGVRKPEQKLPDANQSDIRAPCRR